MKYFIVFLFLSIFILTNQALATKIYHNQEAQLYCAAHPKSYIAIVWPITPQMRDPQIECLFNTYGRIQYKKLVTLSPDFAYTLLKKAHPLITNMPTHFNWYFPSGILKKPARVYIVNFPNTATAITCKYAIRKLCNLQYRAVHINDTHTETIEFAELLFT